MMMIREMSLRSIRSDRFCSLPLLHLLPIPQNSMISLRSMASLHDKDLLTSSAMPRRDELAGTVKLYHRHFFLSYQDPQRWPPQLETSENDLLPRSLSVSLIKSRIASSSSSDSSVSSSSASPKQTRLTIYEATGSDGDLLIFPDMLKYKGLTVSNIEQFVEDVVVKEKDWSQMTPEKLMGSYAFVCAHGTRDRRCGTCGPPLVETFNKEIRERSLANDIFVRSCSHVGGHKYAGNVIIFSPDASGEISGHWYGYVTPNDVAVLLDEHIGKRKIIEKLWRGQMGLHETEQKLAHQKRLEESNS